MTSNLKHNRQLFAHFFIDESNCKVQAFVQNQNFEHILERCFKNPKWNIRCLQNLKRRFFHHMHIKSRIQVIISLYPYVINKDQ